MTQVRIRHQDELKAKVLGEVELKDEALDNVLSLLRMWGLRAPQFDYDGSGDGLEVVAQFVLDETGAYFEVVACE